VVLVGREIAAAVRHELTDDTGARLDGIALKAAAAELRAVRDRILGASAAPLTTD
jgi:hypothetical protein